MTAAAAVQQRIVAMDSAERVRVLRNLLKAADGCRLMLSDKERNIIAEAVELYEQSESGSDDT